MNNSMISADITILEKKASPNIDLRIGTVVDLRAKVGSSKNFQTKTDFIYTRNTLSWFYGQHFENFKKFFKTAAETKQCSILDLGCGDGFGLENWINQCSSYHGVDLHMGQLQLARKHISKEKFPNSFFYFGSVNSLHFNEKSFEFLISSEVIEHLGNPFAHLDYYKSRLTPGGYLSLSTPCSGLYCYPFSIFAALRSPRAFKKWRLLLNADEHWDNVIDWHPALRPGKLRGLLEDRGFEIIDHLSCLWYFESHIRWELSLSRLLERFGLEAHLKILDRLMRFYESLTSENPGFLKFSGTRQFILARLK